MEEQKKIDDLLGHLRDYINTRIDEARLALAERASAVIALIIARTIVNIFFLLTLLFASIAAAYALGTWLGATWRGFLTVSAGYFLLGLIIWTAKERLIRIPIMNASIQQLFQNNKHDEKD